jgi:hypothetical protein
MYAKVSGMTVQELTERVAAHLSNGTESPAPVREGSLLPKKRKKNSYWGSMSKAERSAEIRRRFKKRNRPAGGVA